MRSVWPVIFPALPCLFACAPLVNDAGRDRVITLSNGIELPLVDGVTRHPCDFPEADEQMAEMVCVTFPRAVANGENDPQNVYVSLLRQKGFTFAGGASIQYWMSWPGCSARFTLTSFAWPPDGDWDKADTFMLVMGFERPGCGVAPA